MKWTRHLMLGTAAVLTVLTPLASTTQAQAQILRVRRPCVRAAVVAGAVMADAVVTPIKVAAHVVAPRPTVVVQAPPVYVEVQKPVVHVQTPAVNVQVLTPPLLAPARNFSVYYRDNGAWQRFGGYALFVRAQNVAADLAARGWETMVR